MLNKRTDKIKITRRKGIVLAGGKGSRLLPLTLGTSKQLMPIFDKPLIYYPLSTLIMSGVQEVLFISTPHDLPSFQRLLGDGSKWGMMFNYAIQDQPRGIADAFRIGRDYLDGEPSVLILGDNIFFGHGMQAVLSHAETRSGATIFASLVRDPHRFGIVELNANYDVIGLEEKPAAPKSHWAVTGLYFVDGRAPDFADEIECSSRGELEILSLLNHYLQRQQLGVEILHRGYAWLDAGTHESLHQASDFVKTLQDRQGLLVCSPEELAYRNGLISIDRLAELADEQKQSTYGEALMTIVRQERDDLSKR
ncbi:glucose-1-phosphate thymidylyltransferase RfbA [Mesorhizobium retamae]|uniref:Glucose-1-phosphate thymidylyltransferase n=1 Tax=Mesorhizobium retamae TaxID=2912854 RepID=A0ABS9QHP7_9HYPH|nr:glucose-1-phosphate thymidylyltransferase RfbA [Mesorhizobium sp. IRAMC:0171]